LISLSLIARGWRVWSDGIGRKRKSTAKHYIPPPPHPSAIRLQPPVFFFLSSTTSLFVFSKLKLISEKLPRKLVVGIQASYIPTGIYKHTPNRVNKLQTSIQK
jgi:hypothetical protein